MPGLPSVMGGLFDQPVDEPLDAPVLEETPVEEAPVEDEKPELFAKEEEPEEEDAPSVTDPARTTYGKRVERELSKLRRARRIADERADASSAEVQRLTGLVKSTESILAPIRELYPEDRFKDPTSQLRADVQYVNEFEKLVVAGDAAAVALNQRIMSVLRDAQGGPRSMTQQNQPETQTPQADPRVEALLEKAARTEIKGILNNLGFKPGPASMFTDYVVGNLKSLDDVQEDEVLEIAKQLIAERQFTEDDILVAEKRNTKSKRPATSAKGSAPLPPRKAAAPKQAAQPTVTRQETVLERRQREMDEMLNTFGQD